MIELTEKILDEIKESIVREVNPERLYMFGSRARSDAKKDSDIDLLVIEQEPFGSQKSRLNEMSRIRKAIPEYAIPMDILVYSKDEIEKWRHSVNHVVYRCLKEGRLLYERP